MDLQEVQAKVERTLPDDGGDLATLALGVNGEAGEVAEIVKKAREGKRLLDLDHMGEELFDVLWYVVATLSHLGLDLDEVVGKGFRKLEDRYGLTPGV